MKDIAKKAIKSIGKPKERRADKAQEKAENMSMKEKFVKTLRVEQIKDKLKI